MIDNITVDKATQLKNTMDAAYLVFKKTPTFENANIWTAATRAYNDFCITTITNLVKAQEDESNIHEDIIANTEKYKTCKQCGAELLYLTSDNNYIASSAFLENFPGWCYSCLVDYCATHECEGCTVTSRPFKCSFLEVKKFYTQDE